MAITKTQTFPQIVVAAGTGAGTSTSGSAVTAGSLLTLQIAEDNTYDFTVTDDKGNTWVKDVDKTGTGSANRAQVWSVASAAAGVTTITVTPSGGGTPRFCALPIEWAGAATSTPLDVSGSDSETNLGAPVCSAAGVNIASGSVALATFACDRTLNTPTMSGWTVTTSSDDHDFFAYKIFPSGATGETGTMTLGAGAHYAATIAAYKIGVSGFTLTSDQGSYSTSGQTTGLFVSRYLAADYTTYSISGQSATLSKATPGAFNIVADFGTYSITGQDALSNFAINADYGSYSFSGQDVSFIKTTPNAYSILADYATYFLSGQSNRLIWSNAPVVTSNGGYHIAISVKMGI